MNFEFDWVEIPPKSPHRYSIIWLHGLGADGHDFEGIVPELGLSDDLGIRFCFPNAPVRPVTVNGGMAMRAWFDIVDMSLVRQVDKAGILESSSMLLTMIDREIDRGLQSEQILIAGFSQGGVIALDAGLRCRHKLAGILALSTYLPTLPELETELSEANRSVPILMAHGTHDNVIARQFGKASCEALTSMGYPVDWREYPMGHSVSLEEIGDIAKFIRKCFNFSPYETYVDSKDQTQ